MQYPHGPLHQPYAPDSLLRMDPRLSSAGRGVVGRRAPIPRPWLSEHRHDRLESNDSLDLLQPTEWKVSWSKLACCWFCEKEGDSSSRNNKKDARRGRASQEQFPFPAFPILRRNSSSSLLVHENDIYAVRFIDELLGFGCAAASWLYYLTLVISLPDPFYRPSPPTFRVTGPFPVLRRAIPPIPSRMSLSFEEIELLIHPPMTNS